jgi:filamentous hemagglutinin family protein
MRAIYKAISIRLQAFLLIFTPGLLTAGMLLPAILLWSRCAIAQVTSDGTTNTIVNPSGNNFNILNGIEKGNNLFHSFSNFSVPTGGSARFDLINTPNITTIFSRVTGGNVSNIDGLIRTLNSNNPVSLFLMNPNGIVFGQNASLNISGSFVGTTANSIKFADGTEFSAVNGSSPPLLTMSVPVGLQMGQNPGALAQPNPGIALQGAGHTLTSQNPLIGALVPTGLHTGLAVQPGNTLALIGGKIDLNGGILTAPTGHVELGSVTNGTVGLTFLPQGIQFNYEGLSSFDDIQLLQRSLVDVNSINAGSIQVQGRQISLRDGSVLWVQNRGNQVSGAINVRASSSLTLSGTTNDVTVPSGIVTETIGNTAAGNINIATPQLFIETGSRISSRTYSTGASGDLAIKAGTLGVAGYSPVYPDLYSSLGTITLGSGKAGNLSIWSENLSILDGAYLGSTTLSNGQGGNVVVNADRITVKGATPSFFPSIIAGTTLGRGGNGGNITLNTRTLNLQNNGLVATSSIGVGTVGNIIVNASESIDLIGSASNNLYPTAIASTVDYPTTAYRQAFGLSGAPIGSSGNVVVNTPLLKISNQGRVTSSNLGIGDAGTVRINAQNIQIVDGANITALTKAGEGGNIEIQSQNLILRNLGYISATAGQQGNGGNIKINAPIILGQGNSDMIANASQGQGGNIQITTQGIFGLKYRDQLTPDNDITASSQFGVNGNVQINTIGVDPNSGLVQLPANVTDPSQQIATGCASHQGSSFVATGRGGIPQNPTQEIESDRTWSDIRDISAYRKNSVVTAQLPQSPEVLVQATTWHRRADGKIELIAADHVGNIQSSLTCAAVPK